MYDSPMPAFSRSSRSRLDTCDPALRSLFGEVVKRSDCTILEGARSDARQAELFRQGKSKLDGVKQRSKHQPGNDGLSRAVDVACYPIDWRVQDPAISKRWVDFARVVFAVAEEQGVKVRWGMDWNQNWNWRDPESDPRDDPRQTFNDYPHFELVE